NAASISASDGDCSSGGGTGGGTQANVGEESERGPGDVGFPVGKGLVICSRNSTCSAGSAAYSPAKDVDPMSPGISEAAVWPSKASQSAGPADAEGVSRGP